MEYYENLDEIIQFIDALEDIVGTVWKKEEEWVINMNIHSEMASNRIN